MGILEKIVVAKKKGIKARMEELPQKKLLGLLDRIPPPRDFYGAISSQGISLIAEFKRASPSKGPLGLHLSPLEMAKSYERGGAAAISVLTEEDFFLGSLEDLQKVKEGVRIPVLAKDFFLTPYQLYEARVFGADAILLIAGLLGDEELVDLYTLARRLSLGVLLEVHDEGEVERVLKHASQGILGINNRDLSTFSVDMNTTLKLLPLIPKEYLVVSESGIKDHRQVLLLGKRGVNALLVGEALMTGGPVHKTISQLMGGGEDA